MQASAEYRVLVQQVFDQASGRLAEALRAPPGAGAIENRVDEPSLPPAVVLDIDETVLDNGPVQALGIARGRRGFDPTAWKRWVLSHKALALPGALDYALEASARGIRVFYVTNRTCSNPEDCREESATLQNLRELGFPGAEDASLLLRDEEPGWGGEKASRREAIARDFRIVQLVGDDLSDFIPGLRGADPEVRSRLVARHRERFGHTWFLLPNPFYGSWLTALGDSPGAHLDPDLDQLCMGPATPIRHLLGLDGPSHCAGLTVTTRGVLIWMLETSGVALYLKEPRRAENGEPAPRIRLRIAGDAPVPVLDGLVEVRARVIDLNGETVLDASGPDALRQLDSLGEGAP
jgi:acid phosphatase